MRTPAVKKMNRRRVGKVRLDRQPHRRAGHRSRIVAKLTIARQLAWSPIVLAEVDRLHGRQHPYDPKRLEALEATK